MKASNRLVQFTPYHNIEKQLAIFSLFNKHLFLLYLLCFNLRHRLPGVAGAFAPEWRQPYQGGNDAESARCKEYKRDKFLEGGRLRDSPELSPSPSFLLPPRRGCSSPDSPRVHFHGKTKHLSDGCPCVPLPALSFPIKNGNVHILTGHS